MNYDVAFRYSQALDPSALVTIETSLHAIQAAITDCRNAGLPVETDPAVILLVRHLSQIGAQWTDDAVLRRACSARVEKLRGRPMLEILSLRGVAYDAPAKRLFHARGRSAMRRLAAALALEDGSFDIRSNKAGPAISGDVTLHGESIWVQLSVGLFGPGREVCFRKVQDRHDHIGQRNYWASVRDLLEPEQFAARIRQDLRLPASAPDAPCRVA